MNSGDINTPKLTWPMCCGPANKGLAIQKRLSYMGTIDSWINCYKSNLMVKKYGM